MKGGGYKVWLWFLRAQCNLPVVGSNRSSKAAPANNGDKIGWKESTRQYHYHHQLASPCNQSVFLTRRHLLAPGGCNLVDVLVLLSAATAPPFAQQPPAFIVLPFPPPSSSRLLLLFPNSYRRKGVSIEEYLWELRRKEARRSAGTLQVAVT